jgi:hypothetical protein
VYRLSLLHPAHFPFRFEYGGPFGQIRCQFTHLPTKGRRLAATCPTGASLFGLVGSEKGRRGCQSPTTGCRDKLGGGRPFRRAIANYQNIFTATRSWGARDLYLSAVPFEKIGLPTNVPEYGYPAITEGIQHTLYKGMLPPLALLAGLVYLVHRTAGKPDESEGTPRKTKVKKEKS